jgi:predicted nucleic acid-binding protein
MPLEALAETFGLRGHDAAHLASAELLKDRDLVLAAGDKALIQAAKTLGIGVAAMGEARS